MLLRSVLHGFFTPLRLGATEVISHDRAVKHGVGIQGQDLRGIQRAGIDLNSRQQASQGSSLLLIDVHARGKLIGIHLARVVALSHKNTVYVELESCAVTNRREEQPLLGGNTCSNAHPPAGVHVEL